MTSTHRSATARCGGGRNNDRTTIKHHFQAIQAWNAALNVCAAIVLLNTVGLISVARADTVQYPVTASIGSVLPPGKFATLSFRFVSTQCVCVTHLCRINRKSKAFQKQPNAGSEDRAWPKSDKIKATVRCFRISLFHIWMNECCICLTVRNLTTIQSSNWKCCIDRPITRAVHRTVDRCWSNFDANHERNAMLRLSIWLTFDYYLFTAIVSKFSNQLINYMLFGFDDCWMHFDAIASRLNLQFHAHAVANQLIKRW